MNIFRKPDAYLVRHGTTDLNAGNQYRGWEDPELNEEGLQAAEEIANYLSYEQLGTIACSDLKRAIQTSEAVLPYSATTHYVDMNPLIRPWNIGEFSGRDKTVKNTTALRYYIDHPDEVVPDGESLNDFKSRWESTLGHYLSTATAGFPTVIVCHTSNITATHQMCATSEAHDPESHDIVEPGGIVALYLLKTGELQMEPVLGAVIHEATSEAT